MDYINSALPTDHDKAFRGLPWHSEEYISLLSLVLEVVAVFYPSLPDTRPP